MIASCYSCCNDSLGSIHTLLVRKLTTHYKVLYLHNSTRFKAGNKKKPHKPTLLEKPGIHYAATVLVYQRHQSLLKQLVLLLATLWAPLASWPVGEIRRAVAGVCDR